MFRCIILSSTIYNIPWLNFETFTGHDDYHKLVIQAFADKNIDFNQKCEILLEFMVQSGARMRTAANNNQTDETTIFCVLCHEQIGLFSRFDRRQQQTTTTTTPEIIAVVLYIMA
jgi:hypothetical protein